MLEIYYWHDGTWMLSSEHCSTKHAWKGDFFNTLHIPKGHVEEEIDKIVVDALDII